MLIANDPVEPRIVSYIKTENGIVTDIGDSIPPLTGYNEGDFLGKDAAHVFGRLFRRTADMQSSPTAADCFLFNRSLEAMNVKIRQSAVEDTNELKYTIIVKPNSILNAMFPFANQLIADDQIGVGIFQARNFTLLKANMTFLGFFGEPMNRPEHAIGSTLGEIIEGFAGSRAEALWTSVRENGKSVYLNEYRGELKGFDQKYINKTIVPIPSNSEVAYIVAVFRDVTEQVLNRLRIEEQNEATRRNNERLKNDMETKDRFYSLLTHEFKTPLAVIHSAIQLIEITCKDTLPAKPRTYLNYIKQNTFRQMRLVNNLLDLARLREGRFKFSARREDVVSLARKITESVRPYADQKGLRLGFEASPNEMEATVDGEKLERILLNLLSNAIKFTPAGKPVTVVVSSPRQGRYGIRVEDEGVGIPEDKLGVIFERFGQADSALTRQSEGTGIGLALVRLLTEAMGGSITVESAVGQGSAFTVELPVESAIAREEEEAEKPAGPDPNERIVQAVSIEFSDIYFQEEI